MAFTYEELLKRDKVSLDIFWLKDDSIEDSANLPYCAPLVAIKPLGTVQ